MNPVTRTVDLLSLLPTVKCTSPKVAMKASTLGNRLHALSSQHSCIVFHCYRPIPDWNGQ